MSLYWSSTWQRVWATIFLLLILIQLSASLLLFAGEFIHSNKALISPFRGCLVYSDDETASGTWSDAKNNNECQLENNFLPSVVIFCLYVPIVLVAFGLLAAAFAACADDRAVMRLSALCQGLSSILLLVGIVGFVLLYRAYVSWSGLTCWFYACIGAQVELAVTAALTNRSTKKSDNIMDITIA